MTKKQIQQVIAIAGIILPELQLEIVGDGTNPYCGFGLAYSCPIGSDSMRKMERIITLVCDLPNVKVEQINGVAVVSELPE